MGNKKSEIGGDFECHYPARLSNDFRAENQQRVANRLAWREWRGDLVDGTSKSMVAVMIAGVTVFLPLVAFYDFLADNLERMGGPEEAVTTPVAASPAKQNRPSPGRRAKATQAASSISVTASQEAASVSAPTVSEPPQTSSAPEPAVTAASAPNLQITTEGAEVEQRQAASEPTR